MVLDGPMMGEWFAGYAQQVPSPTLRPGGIVILGNLPAHRMLLFSPRSPDFDPIEYAFSRLRSILRKAPHGSRVFAARKTGMGHTERGVPQTRYHFEVPTCLSLCGVCPWQVLLGWRSIQRLFAAISACPAAVHSHQAHRLEASMALPSNNNVILDGNPEQSTCFDDLVGNLNVGAAGFRVA